jgi:hypothetical protein
MLKSAVKLFPVHDAKAYGGIEVWLVSFLTSALHGGEWSVSFDARVSAQGTGAVGDKSHLSVQQNSVSCFLSRG